MSVAMIFYVDNSDYRDQINNEGWGCQPGEAYHKATSYDDDFCYKEAKELGMLKIAAILKTPTLEGNEYIWTRMQNLNVPWTEYKKEEFIWVNPDCFQRSMSIGDLVYWSDFVQWYRAEFVGFKPIEPI